MLDPADIRLPQQRILVALPMKSCMRQSCAHGQGWALCWKAKLMPLAVCTMLMQQCSMGLGPTVRLAMFTSVQEVLSSRKRCSAG